MVTRRNGFPVIYIIHRQSGQKTPTEFIRILLCKFRAFSFAGLALFCPDRDVIIYSEGKLREKN